LKKKLTHAKHIARWARVPRGLNKSEKSLNRAIYKCKHGRAMKSSDKLAEKEASLIGV